MNSSILINNVEIFDGTNEATVRGNVLVKNGLIEKITQESVRLTRAATPSCWTEKDGF